MIIKMEPNVRNYLYRMLEEKETELELLLDKKEYERQINLIRIAKERLTGKEPAMNLIKESSLMSMLED
jgi:hypothetical protein